MAMRLVAINGTTVIEGGTNLGSSRNRTPSTRPARPRRLAPHSSARCSPLRRGKCTGSCRGTRGRRANTERSLVYRRIAKSNCQQSFHWSVKNFAIFFARRRSEKNLIKSIYLHGSSFRDFRRLKSNGLSVIRVRMDSLLTPDVHALVIRANLVEVVLVD